MAVSFQINSFNIELVNMKDYKLRVRIRRRTFVRSFLLLFCVLFSHSTVFAAVSSYVHIDPLLRSTWPGAPCPNQGLSFPLTACYAKRKAVQYNEQQKDRFIHEVKRYGRVNHACHHRVKYAWHTTIPRPLALNFELISVTLCCGKINVSGSTVSP